jgi:hypothetical protein
MILYIKENLYLKNMDHIEIQDSFRQYDAHVADFGVLCL